MNRLLLTLRYPRWRIWNTNFIYFYNDKDIDGMGNMKIACILNISTDELVEDYRKRNEDKIMV